VQPLITTSVFSFFVANCSNNASRMSQRCMMTMLCWILIVDAVPLNDVAAVTGVVVVNLWPRFHCGY
jgi:hypothetical protein